MIASEDGIRCARNGDDLLRGSATASSCVNGLHWHGAGEDVTRHTIIFIAVLAVLPFAVSAATPGFGGLYWVMTGSNIAKIYADDASLAAYLFDTRRAYAVGNEDGVQNQVIPNFASTATLKYESYARFHEDVQNGRIGASIGAVIYDPEAWPATPFAEKRDPKRYMRQFARLARRHGYFVINAPSRDLVGVRLAYCRKRPRETRSRAYLRCGIAAEGARHADAFAIQAQVHEHDPATYRWFVKAARAQARAANPNVIVLSNLATSPFDYVATPQMLWDAFDAVDDLVDGHVMTINAPERGVAEAFFRMIRAART